MGKEVAAESRASLVARIKARVRLEARVNEREETLEIAWSLTSDLPEAIVVLHYLYRDFDAAGLLGVDPNLAYVEVGADGAIDVSKKLLTLPRGIRVLTPFVALGEELAPGGKIAETFSLRRPITSWDPYKELIHQTTGYPAMQPVRATLLRFHVGVYIQEPGRPHNKVETALGPLIYPNYQPAIDAQVVIDAPPVQWVGEANR